MKTIIHNYRIHSATSTEDGDLFFSLMVLFFVTVLAVIILIVGRVENKPISARAGTNSFVETSHDVTPVL